VPPLSQQAIEGRFRDTIEGRGLLDEAPSLCTPWRQGAKLAPEIKEGFGGDGL